MDHRSNMIHCHHCLNMFPHPVERGLLYPSESSILRQSKRIFFAAANKRTYSNEGRLDVSRIR